MSLNNLFMGMMLLMLLGALPDWAYAYTLTSPINVLQNGAKGDCLTDDTLAIQNAITTAASTSNQKGAVYFPTPPGGCYLVSSAITAPGSVNGLTRVKLTGDGPDLSIIRAAGNFNGTGTQSTVLYVDANFSLYDMTGLTFDANGKANYALYFNTMQGGHLSNIYGLNALQSDIYLDSTATSRAYGIMVTGSSFSNDPNITGLPLPPYNVVVDSTDNVFTNNNMSNASIANIYEMPSGSSGNHFTTNHGWNWYTSQLTVAELATYNFIAGGFASQWIGNQADGSQNAGFYVNNWGVIVEGNHIQLARRHGVCVNPTGGESVITGNFMSFIDSNANFVSSPSPSQDVVMANLSTGTADCGDAASDNLNTAYWESKSNVIVNNMPYGSNESLWATVYSSNRSIGVGTQSPQATVDVNGTLRLAPNSWAPVCNTSGVIAMTANSTLCVCNGKSWVSSSDGKSACVW